MVHDSSFFAADIVMLPWSLLLRESARRGPYPDAPTALCGMGRVSGPASTRLAQSDRTAPRLCPLQLLLPDYIRFQLLFPDCVSFSLLSHTHSTKYSKYKGHASLP